MFKFPSDVYRQCERGSSQQRDSRNSDLNLTSAVKTSLQERLILIWMFPNSSSNGRLVQRRFLPSLLWLVKCVNEWPIMSDMRREYRSGALNMIVRPDKGTD